MIGRRSFVRRGALWTLGAAVIEPLELLDRLTWRRTRFPSAALLPYGCYAWLEDWFGNRISAPVRVIAEPSFDLHIRAKAELLSNYSGPTREVRAVAGFNTESGLEAAARSELATMTHGVTLTGYFTINVSDWRR